MSVVRKKLVYADFEKLANQNSDTPTGSASDLNLELGPHRILFGNYFKLNYALKYDKPLFQTHTAETISIHKGNVCKKYQGGITGTVTTIQYKCYVGNICYRFVTICPISPLDSLICRTIEKFERAKAMVYRENSKARCTWSSLPLPRPQRWGPWVGVSPGS